MWSPLPNLNYSFSLPFSRYTLMMNCWGKLPEKRPSFSDIVLTVSKYTEIIAGYLDINFNPFTSTHDLTSNEAAAASVVPDSPDNDKDILISAELWQSNWTPIKRNRRITGRTNQSRQRDHQEFHLSHPQDLPLKPHRVHLLGLLLCSS